MPVLNKHELEKAVADACALLDHLLLPETADDGNRPTVAVNRWGFGGVQASRPCTAGGDRHGSLLNHFCPLPCCAAASSLKTPRA